MINVMNEDQDEPQFSFEGNNTKDMDQSFQVIARASFGQAQIQGKKEIWDEGSERTESDADFVLDGMFKKFSSKPENIMNTSQNIDEKDE